MAQKSPIISFHISEFSQAELREAGQLLIEYAKRNTTSINPRFTNYNVTLCINTNTRNVFIYDDNYECMMLNGSKLEGFYTSPDEGFEGFFDELVENMDATWSDNDIAWISRLAIDLGQYDKVNNALLTIHEETNSRMEQDDAYDDLDVPELN